MTSVYIHVILHCVSTFRMNRFQIIFGLLILVWLVSIWFGFDLVCSTDMLMHMPYFKRPANSNIDLLHCYPLPAWLGTRKIQNATAAQAKRGAGLEGGTAGGAHPCRTAR